jgi:hypothetical protein
MKIKILGIILVAVSSFAFSQAADSGKPKMKFLGAYDAGQPNVSIIKLLDPTDDVLCYVLVPDIATRKQVDKDKWTYDANNVGSISCLKVMVPVIAVSPKTQADQKK